MTRRLLVKTLYPGANLKRESILIHSYIFFLIIYWLRIDREFHDKALAELALVGIGVHHAGLTLEDRRCTEELFLSKVLRVVVSTSVRRFNHISGLVLTMLSIDLGRWRQPTWVLCANFVLLRSKCIYSAAHTVVVKGVKMFRNGINKEYSDLDVMQMMGRAGRPQFGKRTPRLWRVWSYPKAQITRVSL